MRNPHRTRRLMACAIVGVAALLVTSCEFVPIPGVTGCTITPANSFWRARVTGLPAHPSSASWIASAGSTRTVHADFGSGLWDGGPIGIPYDVVDGSVPAAAVTFTYADESDAGPYRVPANPSIEGGNGSTGDRHILLVDRDTCRLAELYAAYPAGAGAWSAGSGAVWDMRSNAMRPAGWTSADAAGLPILPGLVRYEEVEAGKVLHAIRVTLPQTRRTYVWPASHQAGSTTSAAVAPMGAWLRLKPSVDESTFPPQAQPIVRALKTYGAVVADNGSAFYLSGVPDARWDNDQLRTLGRLTGADFEFVDASSLQVAPNSYEATTAS
ncbi:MAG: hypothetical protein KDB33_07545 [Acidimicrobiales bacterium]|nr:hypothetical protein [Acidimicrobiales bacterium]MCB1260226.1 hypothetical protein [Acidimicrobiales bacterium]